MFFLYVKGNSEYNNLTLPYFMSKLTLITAILHLILQMLRDCYLYSI